MWSPSVRSGCLGVSPPPRDANSISRWGSASYLPYDDVLDKRKLPTDASRRRGEGDRARA